MSLKMKLTASVSAFFLVLGLMLMGVFAVEKATVNMGGSISFTATDVYARVTGSIANAQGEYANKTLPTLEFSAEDDTPDQSGWSNLNLNFDDQATPIEVTIKVENLSAQNTLRVNLNDTITSPVENFKKEVEVVGSDVPYENASEITLQPDTGTTNNETTFTITFSVENRNNSVSADFNYQINLFDQYYVPKTYDGLTFSVDEKTKTATVTGCTGTETDIIIPKTFSISTIDEYYDHFTINDFSSMSEQMQYSIYFGTWNYTDANGQKGTLSADKLMIDSSILETLATPIDVEVDYTVTLPEYSEFNLQRLNMYMQTFDQLKDSDNIDGGFNAKVGDNDYVHHNSSDEFYQYLNANFTTEESAIQAFPMIFKLDNPVVSKGEIIFVEGNDYTVTEIEDGYHFDLSHNGDVFGAFSNPNIKTLILPNTLKRIGLGAFAHSSIKQLDIPDSVESIGMLITYDCPNLTNVILPESLKSIETQAFSESYGQKHLTSINFDKCVNLESIGANAFEYCSKLTSIDLSACAKLKYIDKSRVFIGCNNLTNVIIPEGLVSIGEWTFANCTSLASVTIPDSVTRIGNYAFYRCSSLTSINIPDGLTSIGDFVFQNCTSLEKVIFGNNPQLTGIGSSAFSDCYNLTSINIPASVIGIGRDAFYHCYALAEIYNYSRNIHFVEIGNSSYNTNGYLGQYALVVYNPNDLTANKPDTRIKVENNVQYYIGDGEVIALAPSIAKNDLTILTLMSDTTSINQYAFQECSSLTSVTIPDSVINIGRYAFSDCVALVEVYNYSSLIPEVAIGNSSYSTNGYLGQYAKVVYNTSDLTEAKPDTRIEVDEENHVQYYVWNGEVVALAPSIARSELTTLTLRDDTTSINTGAFSDCSNLTSVTIPDSVTSIGGSAFIGCSSLTGVYISDIASWCKISFGGSTSNPLYCAKNLYLNGELVTELVIPETIAEIKNYAFYNCTSLTSVTIGNSVTSIGDQAFFECSSLTSVDMSGCTNLTSIGSQAFYDCSNLTGVYISDIVSWCEISFSEDTSNPLFYANNLYLNGELVTELVIPETMAEIKNYAFYNCSSLTSVTIPDSVTSIGSSAFCNCSGLTSVTINEYVFRNVTSSWSSCGCILDNINITKGEKVYVPAEIIDGVGGENGLTNDYLDDTTYFTRSESAVDGYYVYTKI